MNYWRSFVEKVKAAYHKVKAFFFNLMGKVRK